MTISRKERLERRINALLLFIEYAGETGTIIPLLEIPGWGPYDTPCLSQSKLIEKVIAVSETYNGQAIYGYKLSKLGLHRANYYRRSESSLLSQIRASMQGVPA